MSTRLALWMVARQISKACGFEVMEALEGLGNDGSVLWGFE